VGTASTRGAARQELRYLFRPVGAFGTSTDFYVYVGHYKAGTDSASVARRNVEAQQVRANADALGPAAHALYTGDFNSQSSNEPAQQTLLAPGGSGRAFDPINRLGSWHDAAAVQDQVTEATAVVSPLPGLTSGGINNRYDLLWETAPVMSGTGLQAVPSTYHPLGNNGSVPFHQSIDYPSNTALGELPNRLAVLNGLANDTSDHLPLLETFRVVRAALGTAPVVDFMPPGAGAGSGPFTVGRAGATGPTHHEPLALRPALSSSAGGYARLTRGKRLRRPRPLRSPLSRRTPGARSPSRLR
jgi:hypothetical protein